MKKEKPVILVVDDERDNVELLDSILSASNYEIIKAYDGNEALKVIEQDFSRIDLVLLDVMMPGLDGFGVCLEISKNNLYSDIPVVLLTALNDNESHVKAFNLGAVDFISKPFSSEVVIARVKTQVELKLKREHLNALLTEKIELNKKLNFALKKIFYLWIFLILFLILFAVVLFI